MSRSASFFVRLLPCVALASLFGVIALGCSSGEDKRPPTGGTGGSGAGGMGGSGADACADVECDPGMECVAEGTSASCVCVEEGCVPQKCESDSCDPNATCTDKKDGFTCTCNTGYAGNGFTCEEDELCKDIVCSGANQRCISDGVAAACVCRSGFETDVGNDCKDIDECLADACGNGAECSNFPGGYSCDCPSGFEENGSGDCVAADLCGGPGNVCDDLGMLCDDSFGEIECGCEPDEIPGVTFCKATTACTAGVCNAGDCQDTETGYFCYCPAGTTGANCADTTTCSLTTVLNASSNPIISDPTLRRVIENAAGVFDGSDVTVGDLASVVVLNVNRLEGESALASLAGLECLPWLQEIYLSDGDVSNLAPLTNLNALRALDLSCNPVTSLGALAGKTGLKELRLAQSGACSGTSAHLASPSTLANLAGLQVLDVTGQSISSNPGLSSLPFLRELNITGNAIDPINGLGSMPSLQVLVAAETGATSLSGLTNFPSLRSLDVSGSAVSSLAGVGSAPELRSLSVNDLGLTTLSGLAAAAKLSSLSATGNALTSAAAIAASPTLHAVSLYDNSITSLADLVSADPLKFRGNLQVFGNDLDCSKYQAHRIALADAGIFVSSDCD